MTDQELLEFAAKAAGIDLIGFTEFHPWPVGERKDGGWWDPMTDGEDVLLMASSLNMSIDYGSGTVFAKHRTSDGFWLTSSSKITADDPCKAYRMAIIECAAEIGKSMEKSQCESCKGWGHIEQADSGSICATCNGTGKEVQK